MPGKPPEKSAKAAKPRKAIAKPSDHLNASRKIDEKIADLGDWRGERLSEIRRIIREVAPGVIEEWKWMGSPAWSHGGIFAVANAHKDKVKLTFAHGAELPDPMKLFNATLGGNTWRAIDLREGDRIDDAALRALVREAVTHNTTQPVKPILLIRRQSSDREGRRRRACAVLHRGHARLEKRCWAPPRRAYHAHCARRAQGCKVELALVWY